jgi:hypothetical protein
MMISGRDTVIRYNEQTASLSKLILGDVRPMSSSGKFHDFLRCEKIGACVKPALMEHVALQTSARLEEFQYRLWA